VSKPYSWQSTTHMLSVLPHHLRHVLLTEHQGISTKRLKLCSVHGAAPDELMLVALQQNIFAHASTAAVVGQQLPLARGDVHLLSITVRHCCQHVRRGVCNALTQPCHMISTVSSQPTGQCFDALTGKWMRFLCHTSSTDSMQHNETLPINPTPYQPR
jgi:hypothetical protein